MSGAEGWRPVSRHSGRNVDYYYDEDNDRCVLRYQEDAEPYIEANKRLAGSWDGWNRTRDMRLAARIPPTVQYEWLQKYGVKAWDKNHKQGVIRLLNSSDYRYLRVGHFII